MRDAIPNTFILSQERHYIPRPREPVEYFAFFWGSYFSGLPSNIDRGMGWRNH